MKRVISILVIVAMMLASVLAMVPAFAAEAAAEPLATYNVNWKELDENGTMRSQWCYDRTQNDFKTKYNVTTTENSLTLSPIGNGDARQYYSDVMFDITDDTYYVYEFEAENKNFVDAGAGVVFAWAADPNAHIGGRNPKEPAGDDYPGVPKSAYYIQGNYADASQFSIHFGAANGGYEVFNTSVSKPVIKDIKFVDNFAKYKIVYNGRDLDMFYLNTEDNEDEEEYED